VVIVLKSASGFTKGNEGCGKLFRNASA